jgi:hypothetical protein
VNNGASDDRARAYGLKIPMSAFDSAPPHQNSRGKQRLDRRGVQAENEALVLDLR